MLAVFSLFLSGLAWFVAGTFATVTCRVAWGLFDGTSRFRQVAFRLGWLTMTAVAVVLIALDIQQYRLSVPILQGAALVCLFAHDRQAAANVGGEAMNRGSPNSG